MVSMVEFESALENDPRELSAGTPQEVINSATKICPVQVSAIVNSVSRIDALEHMLDMELYVEASWVLDKHPDHVCCDKEWSPQLAFTNCVDEKSMTGRVKVKRVVLSPDGSKTVHMARSWCVRGTFTCYFHLSDFPYDKHIFYVHATTFVPYAQIALLSTSASTSVSEDPALGQSSSADMLKRALSAPFNANRAVKQLYHGRIEFIPQHETSFVHTRNFVLRDTWALEPHVNLIAGTTRAEDAETGQIFPTLRIGLKVKRKHEFYYTNVLAPSLMYVSVPFFNVLIPPDNISGRLDVIVAMLLTAVAFKFVINEYLPSICYLTLMDKYLLTGTAFIFLTLFHAAFVKILSLNYDETLNGMVNTTKSNLINHDTICVIDYVVTAFLTVSWVAVNVLFVRTEGRFFKHCWCGHAEAVDEATDGSAVSPTVKGDSNPIKKEAEPPTMG